MDDIFAALISALWLGILTSISPCPLATNLAAISFIGNKVGSSLAVLLSGLFYTLGRIVAYVGISFLLVSSLLSVPEIARFLQEYINIILGPMLIIVGLILLNVIKSIRFNTSNMMEKAKGRAGKMGLFGAFFLGFVFALSLCPVSAGIFFGSLIPLSVKFQSNVQMPAAYGLGTALPVIGFAFVIAFGTQYIGKIFKALQKFEFWAQRITGVLFILIGLYIIYDTFF